MQHSQLGSHARRVILAAAPVFAGLVVLAAKHSPDMPPWLAERASPEAALAAKSSVVHDFLFVDRIGEGGITSVHRIVDDAGRNFKPVHYDHGNGMAAADVDGDGLVDLYFETQLGTNALWKN